jgi:16S rRNA (uracil1498-N3)-methyltransferase
VLELVDHFILPFPLYQIKLARSFMSQRFFLNSKPTGPKVVLEGDQAHHAIHVMRFQEGDPLVLFDGSGVEYRCVIDEIAKKRLSLSIVKTVSNDRMVSTRLTLAVALPKGDRQKFLIEKLVELGVERLVPLKTTRSVAIANEKVIQRLSKQVVEACKQCGRNRLMQIGTEQTLTQLAADVGNHDRRLIADPYNGIPIANVSERSNSVVLAIGPEGGFDPGENELALELGFEPVRLGPAILRVETAAIAAAAIFGIGTE